MNDLFLAARDAFERAYAPYSGFRVGAALRGAGGGVHAGANVENAAFPQSQCAEASAIGAMVTAGETRIVEALVLGGGETPCAPCGGCRQRLNEFAAGPELPIHLCGPEGLRRTVTLGELLPLAFGPGQLGGSNAPTPAATAAEAVRARAPGFAPRVGLILGSGLGPAAELIENALAIPYADLPGFPRPSVEGHHGRLLLGTVAGTGVACLQGRVHLYEGVPASAINAPIRALRSLGCEILIATNASGSLTPVIAPGSIALIEDHVNLLGANPLTGPNDAVGPRFPDLSAAYDPELRARLRAVADRLGIALPGAVYLAVPGPSFETPAEIRAFRALGADLVGMSTVPEVISARHCGLRVAGLSIVTNLAAGIGGAPLSHDETLAVARRAALTVAALLRAFMEDLAHAAGR